VTLAKPFGAYYTSTVARGDTALLYVRSLEMKQAVIPAEQYNQVVEFYKAIARADKAQVVLTRKD
jgi:hypothetical protein